MSAATLTARQLGYVNRAFWRNPASAFFTFVLPLMFLVIFTALLGDGDVRVGGRVITLSTYYVAVMTAFAVMTACFNNIAVALTFQRDAGVLKRINGTPLPASVFFGARVVHALLVPVKHFTDGIQAGYVGLPFDWTDVWVVGAWGLAGLLVAIRFFSWQPKT